MESNSSECDTGWQSGSPAGINMIAEGQAAESLNHLCIVTSSVCASISSIWWSLSRTYRRASSGRLFKFIIMIKVGIYNLGHNREIESATIWSPIATDPRSIGASDALITGFRCVVRQWLNITLKISTNRRQTRARIVLKSSMDSWMWARFRLVKEFNLNLLDLYINEGSFFQRIRSECWAFYEFYL